jgi:SAM-dependent methyltransferase
MGKKFLRLIGTFLLIDGLLTLIFGRRFVRLFRFGPKGSSFRRTIGWLLSWPAWLLRGSGASEAALGVSVLKRVPLDVPTLYSSIAGGYAAIDPGWRKWFYSQAHQAFDRALVDGLPPDGAVLDLGCGVGGNLSRFVELKLPFGSYIGVDLSPAMLAKAKERYGHIPNVTFQPLDLMRDPLPAGPFDLIVSTWVFEHLPDPVFAARKAFQKLKPGGRMVLLFDVEADSLISRLIGWAYPILSVHLVKGEAIWAFPGTQSVQYFDGLFGTLAVVTLRKPVPEK